MVAAENALNIYISCWMSPKRFLLPISLARVYGKVKHICRRGGSQMFHLVKLEDKPSIDRRLCHVCPLGGTTNSYNSPI